MTDEWENAFPDLPPALCHVLKREISPSSVSAVVVSRTGCYHEYFQHLLDYALKPCAELEQY